MNAALHKDLSTFNGLIYIQSARLSANTKGATNQINNPIRSVLKPQAAGLHGYYGHRLKTLLTINLTNAQFFLLHFCPLFVPHKFFFFLPLFALNIL